MPTPNTVTITVTRQQLTDIRVSVLTRLDRLNKLREAQAKDAEANYERVRALMAPGGPLHTALLQSTLRVADIT